MNVECRIRVGPQLAGDRVYGEVKVEGLRFRIGVLVLTRAASHA